MQQAEPRAGYALIFATGDMISEINSKAVRAGSPPPAYPMNLSVIFLMKFAEDRYCRQPPVASL
jgi:hypothetical protein